MILGFDIGNTHIVPIFYSDEGEILASFRIPTNLTYTEDTFFAVLKTLAENSKIDIYKTQSIIVSSVVPHINEIFYYFGKKYFKLTPKFISLENTKNEIIFSENFERGLGADRICDILALKKTYKKNEFDRLLFFPNQEAHDNPCKFVKSVTEYHLHPTPFFPFRQLHTRKLNG